MNITTPMNWVNSNSGVKNDHTFHKATLKLQGPNMGVRTDNSALMSANTFHSVRGSSPSSFLCTP